MTTLHTIQSLLMGLFLGYGTGDCVGNPPPKYEHDTTAIVHFVSQAEINRACGQEVIACSDDKQMWVRNTCFTKEAENLDSVASDICHELGHINGWPADHPLK